MRSFNFHQVLPLTSLFFHSHDVLDPVNVNTLDSSPMRLGKGISSNRSDAAINLAILLTSLHQYPDMNPHSAIQYHRGGRKIARARASLTKGYNVHPVYKYIEACGPCDLSRARRLVKSDIGYWPALKLQDIQAEESPSQSIHL